MSAALDLVKRFEGFSPTVYLCPAGYWTIGYGHVCRQDHPAITSEEGEAYLDQDLNIARVAVAKFIVWPINEYQFDALTSWTFNLGASRLRGSTLRAVINRGELDEAPDQFRRWVYAGARKLAGLVARREAEAALFQS